jgi:hypothetical protein
VEHVCKQHNSLHLPSFTILKDTVVTDFEEHPGANNENVFFLLQMLIRTSTLYFFMPYGLEDKICLYIF